MAEAININLAVKKFAYHVQRTVVDEAFKHLGPDRNLGVWGKKTLPEVLEEAKNKYGHLTNEELDSYKMSHGHCVMSKY